MVSHRSFKNEDPSEASDAGGPSTGVAGFSTKVTPAPTSAVMHRSPTGTSPTTPAFRSKVATLRPPGLDRSAAPSPPPLAGEDEGEVIDLLDSVPPPPPPPVPVATQVATPDAPTVEVQSPEPGRAGRRWKKGFAAIGACLLVGALGGWFLSRRHHRTATTPVADGSTTQAASATPAPAAPPPALADKAAPIDNTPAPSASASARKPKPGAPRPSRPLKSRHK